MAEMRNGLHAKCRTRIQKGNEKGRPTIALSKLKLRTSSQTSCGSRDATRTVRNKMADMYINGSWQKGTIATAYLNLRTALQTSSRSRSATRTA